jgi:hypothetical protein
MGTAVPGNHTAPPSETELPGATKAEPLPIVPVPQSAAPLAAGRLPLAEDPLAPLPLLARDPLAPLPLLAEVVPVPDPDLPPAAMLPLAVRPLEPAPAFALPPAGMSGLPAPHATATSNGAEASVPNEDLRFIGGGPLEERERRCHVEVATLRALSGHAVDCEPVAARRSFPRRILFAQ